MDKIIEKIRKIDKKTMRNNILLGLIVTLGTGFYLYMTKKPPIAPSLEENGIEYSDNEKDDDKYSSDEDESDYENNYEKYNETNNNTNDESQKMRFEDLKQSLMNKIEETDKNNQIELKKLEGDIRTISEKLDKNQIANNVNVKKEEKLLDIQNDVINDKDKDVKEKSFLDYIFPSSTKEENKPVEEKKPLEEKKEVLDVPKPILDVPKPILDEKNDLLIPEVIDKPVADNQVIDKPVADNQVIDKPVIDNQFIYKPVADNQVIDKPVIDNQVIDKPVAVPEVKKQEEVPEVANNPPAGVQEPIVKENQEEKKIEGGSTLSRKKKSKKNKNKVLNQILKKLCYTLKKK